ncbi:TIGR01457 family HAD-type hydrolase [Xylocopilactobacillus apicola]|nr:TIGR01457 family HAD-type hydrolase [Xylocopilactobacillus apicola]
MRYQGYLIDLDGTIYRGKEKIPSAVKFIKDLFENHLKFRLVTNNTTRTPEAIVDFLHVYHQIDVELSNIYTASKATAEYIARNKTVTCPHVYVIGENGLKTELANYGFIYDELDPDYVVVGLDSDVTYHKLEIAALAIEKGAIFIGTNPDRAIPKEVGLVPSAGALIGLLQIATKVDPVIIGKPQTIMLDLISEDLNVAKENLVLFGDNYDTDILGGINFGIDTALVLTGVTKREDLKSVDKLPKFILDSLEEWHFA